MLKVHLNFANHPIKINILSYRKLICEAQNQCFSTVVPRNLRVPRVAAIGSAETDRNCLGRNSQPQFYATVAI